jgi:ribonuclease-3
MQGSAEASDFAALEPELGYVFRNRLLLTRAITHKSWAFENNQHEAEANNEQLEFLGDSILGFLVSEHLVAEFPGSPEGCLSQLKAQLVSSVHLYQVARELDLGRYLILGRGEQLNGGRSKKAILANAVEAIIAAIYLDGGVDPVRQFVVDRVVKNTPSPDYLEDRRTNYKSALQELARVKNLPQPHYRTLAERGPEHAKTFVVEVRVGRQSSRAEGMSKKSAGQNAARLVLDQLSSDARG